MKRVIPLVIILMLLVSAVCKAETFYGVNGEPYYHTTPSCEYGISSNNSRVESAQKGTLQNAAYCNMRACPSCASQWIPYFTATFPEWTYEVQPWEIGYAEHVSSALLKSWGGNVADKIEKVCRKTTYGVLETTKYPDDYAGVFVNASGCYTVLMVNPTVERAEKYSSILGCEFWVLSADYSMIELIALQNAVQLVWVADTNNVLKINTCGINAISNRVEIGTTDGSKKNVNNLYKCIEALGYTKDMVTIYKVNEANDWDF